MNTSPLIKNDKKQETEKEMEERLRTLFEKDLGLPEYDGVQMEYIGRN